MWQVLLAAAVAGSGFFAKRFLNFNGAEPISLSEQTNRKCDQPQGPHNPSKPQVSSPASDEHNNNNTTTEIKGSTLDEESIFRFSSASGSRIGSKIPRKKSGSGSRGIRGNAEGVKNVEKKNGVVNGGERLALDQRKSGKRFAVCLKKRRTSKNTSAKCESCSSKDNPSFGLGLGVGLMYMMSAGKAEISRLNTVMDETAKVVQGLKTEIAKRKSSRNLHVSSSKAEANTNPEKIRSKHSQSVPTKSSNENRDEIEVFSLPITDDGECGSSVLTEEPHPEVLEMDQLEAELESELQKLPLCTTDDSGCEKGIADILKSEVPPQEFYEPDGQSYESYRYNGVMPSELDQKLCHLVIEQQESQIVELESELKQTNSKLHEKEAELQTLKDCVRRLTEFSLASASDEEIESQVEEKTSDEVCDKMGPELKKSVIGMKRAMDFESYACSIK